MAVTFAVGIRTCCVAMGLLLGTARAAEPVSPLVGVTRDQLVSRYGEPKSQIEVDNRVIFFYPRERIVLRNNVVVMVEEIAAEALPPNPPSTTGSDPTSATRSVNSPTSPEPKLEIKSVRPPSSKDSRSVVPVAPVAVPAAVSAPPVVMSTTRAATTTPDQKGPSVAREVEQPTPAENVVAPANPDPAVEKAAKDELAVKKKKEDAIREGRRKLAETTMSAESDTSGRMYLWGLVVLAGGAAVLFWRRRQRQLDLVASSVENTPLEPIVSAPIFTGDGFTADMLNQLDWKRFEELVAGYYSKTGVVTVRTKAGPESPVNIKISWKGEPRPFAYVQCIAHPPGLIDPKPLQALVASLSTDDIRRGYVVTTGKFNVQARALAEEKHLTLLPGDIFLEKLNALPAAARTEIMQAISGGEHAVS